mgnify:CR=1 FL=1
MRKILMGVTLLAFIALMSVFAVNLRPSTKEADPMVGTQVPQILVETLTRETDRALTSPVKLINFWATWCAPCIYEHPVLMDLAESGVEIIGVAYNDDPEKIRAFLQKRGDPFSTLHLDPDGVVMLDFGNTGVPETFVIGPDGVIRARVRGPVTPDVFRSEILPALKL